MSKNPHRPGRKDDPRRREPTAPPGISRSRAFESSDDVHREVVGVAHCKGCGADIPYRAKHIGKRIKCPTCKHTVHCGITLMELRNVDRSDVSGGDPLPKMVLPRQRMRLGGPLLLVLACGLGLSAAVFTSARGLSVAKGWGQWDIVPASVASLLGIPQVVDAGESVIPPPDITLAAIEALLTQEDKMAAITQAQEWLQLLADFKTPESDPRIIRLNEIIEELSGLLHTAPEPPPEYVVEFRDALRQLREALIADNLERARSPLARAEVLFAAHEDELSHYSRSLLALKQCFKHLEFRLEGREKVAALIKSAEDQIEQEKATEAAESIANAKFLALHTPSWEEGEYERLSDTVKDLERRLRKLRGQRAVEDAKRCHDQNDLEARNAQLKVAFELLPEGTSSQVEPLLTRARELLKKEIADPQPSQLGRELSYCAAYEDALRWYGRVNTLERLARQCVEAHACLVAADHLDQSSHDKVSELFFSALAFELGDLLARPNISADVPPALAAAKVALDLGTPWKDSIRWRSLDQSLRAKGNDAATFAVARGTEYAEKRNFASAIQAVWPALQLGDPDNRQRARGLHDRWQGDLEWFAIEQSVARGSYLVAWAEVNEFERTFGSAARKPVIEQTRAQIRPSVDADVQKGIPLIEEFLANGDWQELRNALRLLEEAPVPPEHLELLERSKARIDNLKNEAKELFDGLTPTQKHAASNAAVIELLDLLPKILAMDPDHEKAAELLKKAQVQAEKRAPGLYMRAKAIKSANKEKCREFANMVIQLAPQGQWGREARKLLESLDKGE